ncbi:hypothetical protein FISHEDRAFT_13958, partial [Fistulina hepatica ATCC 64428]
DVPILHPSVLILTKLKRWCRIYYSSRPKSQMKAASDNQDIRFIIYWMADKQITIDFDKYQGRPRAELVDLVRTY